MALNFLPAFIRENYEAHEWKHACAVLKGDFPTEWDDIIQVLSEFSLNKSDILSPGGGLSPISQRFNQSFLRRGWQEKAFDTQIVVDKREIKTPTHEVDSGERQ